MKRKYVVQKIRDVLTEMYNGYPTYYYYGFIEKAVGFKAIPILEKDLIIHNIGVDPTGQQMYRIGLEGIKLVEQWKVNKLTNWIIALTIGLFVLGIAQLILISLTI